MFINKPSHSYSKFQQNPPNKKEKKKRFDLWSYKPVGKPLNHCAGQLSFLGWRNE